jgi:hypothetical protein
VAHFPARLSVAPIAASPAELCIAGIIANIIISSRDPLVM